MSIYANIGLDVLRSYNIDNYFPIFNNYIANCERENKKNSNNGG